jgi:hypothetical protein
MANKVQLLASYWSIAGGAWPHSDHEYSVYSFEDRVASAARAGFAGFGIWHADLERTLKSVPLGEMRRILEDHGMVHVELEFLMDWWFRDGERTAACCSMPPRRSARVTSRWATSPTRPAPCPG